MMNSSQSLITLHDLLDYDARKFTNAEIQLKNCLPEWINMSGSLKLKTVLRKYFDFVQAHVQKMEDFFKEERMFTVGISNRVMNAFIQELEETISNCADAAIKDACLLSCIQAINHFKISTYGTAAAFANALGMEKQALIFHEAEVNEKEIDQYLSQLAEEEINIKAKAPIELPG